MPYLSEAATSRATGLRSTGRRTISPVLVLGEIIWLSVLGLVIRLQLSKSDGPASVFSIQSEEYYPRNIEKTGDNQHEADRVDDTSRKSKRRRHLRVMPLTWDPIIKGSTEPSTPYYPTAGSDLSSGERRFPKFSINISWHTELQKDQ